MKPKSILFALLLVLVVTLNSRASGPVGVYGMIEKVVFEPNEQTPERIQIWGVFAYADGALGGSTISAVQHGYLYFQIKEKYSTAEKQTTLTEWKDLKSVAGTGQAVAFGKWPYTGTFESLNPAAPADQLPHIYGTGGFTDMRVRPDSEIPAKPAEYQINAGVVKLSDQGNYADVVKKLRAAMKRTLETSN